MEYQDYLRLLQDLCRELDTLAQVERDKASAVREHDLDALNACMKREQAVTLALRGLDQKRERLLSALELSGVSLREMPRRCPAEYREETRRAVERVLNCYEVVRSSQEPARVLLESGLRQVEEELRRQGVEPELDDRYQSAPASRPGRLRTDITD